MNTLSLLAAVRRTLRVAERADLYPGEMAALRMVARRAGVIALAEHDEPDPDPAVVEALALRVRRAIHEASRPEHVAGAARRAAEDIARDVAVALAERREPSAAVSA